MEDPCEPFMNLYLRCVKNKDRGLSEGDECENEANQYKTCRRDQKKKKNIDADVEKANASK